eukprot:TRINITY_DN948_c0_g1_i2.p2 TRINITY_DN948_c0_g1~~TRINITY_DN948_c0_g1_i2.p2  ORF type:complete len:189 (+),score=53.12 TRINITY_DN948_c0_g1_i2:89-655(+)
MGLHETIEEAQPQAESALDPAERVIVGVVIASVAGALLKMTALAFGDAASYMVMSVGTTLTLFADLLAVFLAVVHLTQEGGAAALLRTMGLRDARSRREANQPDIEVVQAGRAICPSWRDVVLMGALIASVVGTLRMSGTVIEHGSDTATSHMMLSIGSTSTLFFITLWQTSCRRVGSLPCSAGVPSG